MAYRNLVAVAIHACFLIFGNLPASAIGAEAAYQVGIAHVDITPTYPARLSGYSNRSEEFSSVAQPLFAKALAITSGDRAPVVLITVDTLGVSADITETIAARLAKRDIPRNNLAVCASHTHSAPALTHVAPLLFPPPVPEAHRLHIDAYTKELTRKLGDVAEAAIGKLEPATLSLTHGAVDFAVNRRLLKEGRWSGFGVVPDGAVDHALPVLAVRDAAGEKLRAVLINYACHCTTLGGAFNQVHGDWAGCAQEQIEREHPGCTALVSIGCGADANPNPRSDDTTVVVRHGDAVAREVSRLLKDESTWTTLAGPITARGEQLRLPLADLPTPAEYEKRAATKGPIAWHAQRQLARLAAGEPLPTSVPYEVRSWTFGDDLAMVFLPGEVVVDYQLRLKRELNSKRLWINAYADAAPCYIASKRVLQEGGYEVDGSMYYYDQPQHFAPEVEQTLIAGVRRIVPDEYVAATRFAADVATIEARDRETSPPKNGIVFIGSSSIRLWNLPQAFPDLPVVNHGFGGSYLSDVNHYFDRLVTPVAPRQIVLYCGSNDLSAGKSPEEVLADFDQFADRIADDFPTTKLTYIAIAPNPKRWSQIDKQRRTNDLIAASIARRREMNRAVEFVGVEKQLLDADGKPQPSLYLKDQLHFNAAGYAVLNKIVAPHLK